MRQCWKIAGKQKANECYLCNNSSPFCVVPYLFKLLNTQWKHLYLGLSFQYFFLFENVSQKECQPKDIMETCNNPHCSNV